MGYKAVLFDLDGTLVYTDKEYRHDVTIKTIKEMNGKIPAENILDKFWFETGREKVIEKFFCLEPKAFWEAFRKHDLTEKRKKSTRPFDDTGFIAELREKKFKTAIVTGSPKHIAEMEIGLVGKENFDAVILANHWENRLPKPHPESIEHCLKILKVKKSEAVFVGNADEDIIAAQNAEILDVFIERKEHFFPEIKPSFSISSLFELRKILE